MEMTLIWIFRAIGLLWIAGGAAVMHQSWQLRRIEQMTDELEEMGDFAKAEGETETDAGPEDRARNLWIGLGGVLIFLTGCSLVAASWLAMPLSLAVCLHQTAYFVRQVWRQRKAKTEEERANEAIAPSTRNATLFAFAVSAFAIHFTVSGIYA